ncbi:MAG TPA: hypothetical protein VEC14_02745 [Reyranellaceae bacterium]|nr:hypothetical protein [Reyranellaceae bacterium]
MSTIAGMSVAEIAAAEQRRHEIAEAKRQAYEAAARRYLPPPEPPQPKLAQRFRAPASGHRPYRIDAKGRLWLLHPTKGWRKA